ncbi:hypothetical protein GF336_00310 [Candidatus Woesearchaeota archaeon]|nr:hypothetical protein [Candidatus Woesearchaeota archaeon]
MKLKKITLEFTSEELEAIHYAMEIGVSRHKKDKSRIAQDWIEIADDIRRRLPIKMRFDS